MTKSQILFWLLAAFILGVAIASFSPASLSMVWAVFVLGGVMASFGMLRRETRQKAIVVGFSLVTLSFGLFWFARSSRVVSSFDPALDGRLIFRGIISDEPVRTAGSQRFIVREEKSGARVSVTARQHPEYRYGDALKIGGKIARPENFSRDFDYAAYLAKDGVFYVMSFPEVEFLEGGKGSRLYQLLFGIKGAFAAALNRHLPEPHASFMSGLILGERKSFPPALTEKLQLTGTTHLVALSGYNITIVADALLKTLTFFFIPWVSAFYVALAGIALFTLLTGAQASVVRAAVMGILVLIARREGRQYRMRNALVLAGALMLLHNPMLLRLDTGFQLSFLATLGLIYIAPLLAGSYDKIKLRLIPLLRRARLIRERREFRRSLRKKSFLGDILFSTLAAQLAVLPLIVYRFGKLSLVSPLANLALLPFIPATMFFGFITGGLGLISDWLARISGAVAWALLHYELRAIDLFSQFRFASVEPPKFGWLALAAAYSIIVFWFVSRSKNGRQ
ncbi:MAG: ComEC family competence protein [Candidatus Sungbacteria bacterium]|nr:ComEC family competence protein [Candidatus Sungbacteria bacterium]